MSGVTSPARRARALTRTDDTVDLTCSECGKVCAQLGTGDHTFIFVSEADAAWVCDAFRAEGIDGDLWYDAYHLVEMGYPSWWIDSPRRITHVGRSIDHAC